MNYLLRHRSIFTYSQPVTFGYNLLHLEPRNLPWQTVLSSTLNIEPAPSVLTKSTDYFGNHTAYCTVQELHSEMNVLIESEIEIIPRSLVLKGGTLWDQTRSVLQKEITPTSLDASQYCFASAAVPILNEARDYALLSCKPGRSVYDVALDLMNRINTEFAFDPTATTVSTPVLEVLEKRRGVCQDFAHLMISCLRSIGLPARYNSGYIRTEPPPGQKRLQGADASHAWVGVFCPMFGWLDLDPTNNKPANEEFITIGWGRDYHDVSPVKGVLMGGGKQIVTAEVDMIPKDEMIQEQQQQ